MKTKIRVLMMILAVVPLGVLILRFQGVIPMDTAANSIVVGVFIAMLLVLQYFGQIEMVKKILLSLVIEAEQIYGARIGKLKYNYVLGKTYAMLPSVIKLFISVEVLDEMLEGAADYLHELLIEREIEIV